MDLHKLKRHHVRSNEFGNHFEHNGRIVRTCSWRDGLAHSGVVVFGNPAESGDYAVLRKGKGKDDWYAEHDEGDDPMEGPYPLNVLLTLMLLRGYTEAY